MCFTRMFLSTPRSSSSLSFLTLENRITVTMFCSFVAAALATTHQLCYSAVASSSIVLILPVGFFYLPSSPELISS